MLTFCAGVYLGSAEVVGARFSERTALAAKRRGVFALTARGTLRVHRRADGQTETTAAGVEIPAACCGVGQTPTDCQTGEPARV